MDHGKPALVPHGNVQQGQGHRLTPGCLALRRTGLVQHTDDVAASLADGLPALVLLECLSLELAQEKRQRLRRGKHGELRGNGPVDVAAQLQAVLLAAAIGIAVFALAVHQLLQAPQIAGHLHERGTLADAGGQLQVRRSPLRIIAVRAVAPGQKRRRNAFGFLCRRPYRLRKTAGDGLFILEHLVADHMAHGFRLVDLALGLIGSLDGLLLQFGKLLRAGLCDLLHQFLKLLHAPVPFLFQALQGIQRPFFSTGFFQQLIQVSSHLTDKFRSGLIGGFDGGIVLAVHHLI